MAVNPDRQLPASIAAAWGLRERPSRGPKPGLSLERIVGAGIDVAVAEGIEAVSMSRVAKELGSSAMSLYRYVAAKDELLALMVDAALGPTTEAPAEGEGWRAGLERWAWTYHDALRRHPWVLRLPISGPPVMPNQVRWLEDGLSALRDTGLSEPEKLSVILLVSGFVRNEATLAADIAAAAAASGVQVMPAWAQLLERVTDAERFPALHAALGSEAFASDDEPDDEFVFGLERVLDGVEALVATRSRPTSAGRARGASRGRSRRSPST
jgi:AcrR family transcriptional regulator